MAVVVVACGGLFAHVRQTVPQVLKQDEDHENRDQPRTSRHGSARQGLHGADARPAHLTASSQMGIPAYS